MGGHYLILENTRRNERWQPGGVRHARRVRLADWRLRELDRIRRAKPQASHGEFIADRSPFPDPWSPPNRLLRYQLSAFFRVPQSDTSKPKASAKAALANSA